MSEKFKKHNKSLNFSEYNESEIELFEAINANTKNFARDTKLMWAEKLNVDYTPVERGAQPK